MSAPGQTGTRLGSRDLSRYETDRRGYLRPLVGRGRGVSTSRPRRRGKASAVAQSIVTASHACATGPRGVARPPSVAIAGDEPSVLSERGHLLVPGNELDPPDVVPTCRHPCQRARLSRRRSAFVAWQDGQDHADVGAELGHVGAEELSGGVVGDLTVVPEDIRGVLDVGLG
jgi:hypothetical protein